MSDSTTFFSENKKETVESVGSVGRVYSDIAPILAQLALLELQANVKAHPQTHANVHSLANQGISCEL